MRYPLNRRGVSIRRHKRPPFPGHNYEVVRRVAGGDASSFYETIEPAIVDALEAAYQHGYEKALKSVESHASRLRKR